MDTDLYDAYGDHDHIPLANPESPSYSAIPPRGQHFRPLGATAELGDTEPKAPPLWEEMHEGPPGYPDSPQATRERPPPYFPSEAAIRHA
ncbi:uncharacterized protein LOC119095351 isoform X2 [Pollicipes pollicipes]|uniref:uncharacterized protein LOC119095351 isoform X2 n=1 Tax=Pollicipes pollicipes TaxID=41117 RepID=UPI001884BB0C|nr:uncharacterized protein LOC119095351 isoform X2 [Pollicipes pollicipes]